MSDGERERERERNNERTRKMKNVSQARNCPNDNWRRLPLGLYKNISDQIQNFHALSMVSSSFRVRTELFEHSELECEQVQEMALPRHGSLSKWPKLTPNDGNACSLNFSSDEPSFASSQAILVPPAAASSVSASLLRCR